MNIAFYAGAAALSALDQWRDAIAGNLATTQVPGAKGLEVSFAARTAGVLAAEGSRSATAAAVVPQAHRQTSHAPGRMVVTGRDLDVAIDGPGFFAVALEDGSTAYTRAGALQVNAESQLVDPAGRAILGDGGVPIQLLPQGGEIVVGRDGTIAQGGTEIGRLAVHRFPDPAQLEPLSRGLFRAPEGVVPEPVESPVVVQGAYEASNVEPITEMARLIAVTRAYEANQRAMVARDELTEKTLRAIQ